MIREEEEAAPSEFPYGLVLGRLDFFRAAEVETFEDDRVADSKAEEDHLGLVPEVEFPLVVVEVVRPLLEDKLLLDPMLRLYGLLFSLRLASSSWVAALEGTEDAGGANLGSGALTSVVRAS